MSAREFKCVKFSSQTPVKYFFHLVVDFEFNHLFNFEKHFPLKFKAAGKSLLELHEQNLLFYVLDNN